jgi:nicotinamidase-related amidase
MRNVLISIPIVIVIIIGLFVFNLILYKKHTYSISLGTEIVPAIIEKPALLIVDIQEGTTGDLSDIEFYKSSSGTLITKINQLIDSAGKYNVPVIYIRNEVSNYLINLINKKLAEGGPGVMMDKRLKKVAGYLMLNEKLDAFSNPGLDSILINRGINKIYFTGLDPAYSIGISMVAAKNRNYKVGLIKDAVVSESGVLTKKKIQEFNSKGYEVISSDEYFKKLPGAGF